MMSKKQWFVLLCLFVLYLLLGASIFYYIESQEEEIKHRNDVRERQYIEGLLRTNYIGNNKTINNLFSRLTDYCGKPVHYNMSAEPTVAKWNYYNSIFFVITVVSTIGYGNLSPTTMFTRIFMIFYGLIGIPMNGIVMVTLGEFFGKSFTKLYQRWKTLRLEKHSAKLGLIGQIILYAVPGLTFFIFLPATIISFFEGWEFDVAVYYAFVTLTTIGFGDYVAGPINYHGFHPTVFLGYHIFLLIWVIGGLGYVLMIIGFITQGMRSRKIAQIEKILADTVKRTPLKIRNEFRSILHEFLFLRVKPIYKGEFEYTPHCLERSQSCPDFTIWRNKNSPSMARKRAMSECYKYSVMERRQSESELDKIDKERTFRPSDALMRQKDLLLKVVDALSLASGISLDNGGVQGFSDDHILDSERYESLVVIPQRRRALSDVNPPDQYQNEQSLNTWYGNDASKALKAFRQKRNRAMSVLPSTEKVEKLSVLQRFQRTVTNKLRKGDRDADIEKQALDRPSTPNQRNLSIYNNSFEPSQSTNPSVLEQTSIADFIRALSAITLEDDYETKPRRKIGMGSLTPPKYYSRKASIIPNLASRRSSLLPTTSVIKKSRRFSMTPVVENLLSAPPPPYSPCRSARNSFVVSDSERFSVQPVITAGGGGDVKSQLIKKKKFENDLDSKD